MLAASIAPVVGKIVRVGEAALGAERVHRVGEQLAAEETPGASDLDALVLLFLAAALHHSGRSGVERQRALMQRATELSQHCDLFLAIGSSLVVWPAAGFPLMAKNCGARLVIINREPTDQDDLADLVIRYDIGETLGPFVGN